MSKIWRRVWNTGVWVSFFLVALVLLFPQMETVYPTLAISRHILSSVVTDSNIALNFSIAAFQIWFPTHILEQYEVVESKSRRWGKTLTSSTSSPLSLSSLSESMSKARVFLFDIFSWKLAPAQSNGAESMHK